MSRKRQPGNKNLIGTLNFETLSLYSDGSLSDRSSTDERTFISFCIFSNNSKFFSYRSF